MPAPARYALPTMDDPRLFVASLLDNGRRAFATGAVDRLPSRSEDELDGTFRVRVTGAEGLLQNLSEALASNAPELFVEHVRWLRDSYAAREVDPTELAASLEALRDELGESLPPGTSDAVQPFLAPAIEAAQAPPSPVASAIEEGGPRVELARRFLHALLEARHDDALELLLEAAEDGVPVSALELDVIARAQEEVGRMWQRGEIQIAEEHLGSTIVRDALALLRQRIPRPPADARRVVVASVGGNVHDIGARIVSDHFALAGWNPVFLGADLPPGDVVWSVQTHEADLVALSATLGLHVRSTGRFVAALKQACPDVPILVGGGPFARIPELWKAVGADGGGVGATEAVKEAERLLPAAR